MGPLIPSLDDRARLLALGARRSHDEHPLEKRPPTTPRYLNQKTGDILELRSWTCAISWNPSSDHLIRGRWEAGVPCARSLSGKRQMGHLAPFDLVLLLVLSNAVQNSMNGGDNSVPGGVISALTLIGLNYVVSFLTFRSKRIARFIEGRPIMLIRDGKINQVARRRAMLTQEELLAALRAEEISSPDNVRFAFLENTGEITIIRKH